MERRGGGRKDQTKLGWVQRFSFEEMVAEMVASDLKIAGRDVLSLRHGYRVASAHE